jgi:hypothetical protein
LITVFQPKVCAREAVGGRMLLRMVEEKMPKE